MMRRLGQTLRHRHSFVEGLAQEVHPCPIEYVLSLFYLYILTYVRHPFL
jgi:hypothetical protein